MHKTAKIKYDRIKTLKTLVQLRAEQYSYWSLNGSDELHKLQLSTSDFCLTGKFLAFLQARLGNYCSTTFYRVDAFPVIQATALKHWRVT